MLSKLSPIGSLVSDEVYLIWISNSISKEKISDRKEFYGITQNGLLFKGTIWTPPSGVKIEAQTWVKLLNFKVIDFKAKKCSSFGPSTIQPSISTKPRPEVKDIFGGIEYESVNPTGHTFREESMLLTILLPINRVSNVVEKPFLIRKSVRNVVPLPSV